MVELTRMFLDRDRLAQMPPNRLFDLHGTLNKRHAERAFKTWKNVRHHEYPVGSFLISVVEADRKFLQIHFAPFGFINMKHDHEGTAIKSIILGLADSDRMLELVGELSNKYHISEISGETNSVMASLAVEMGLEARNHKINPYSNHVSTQDIPQFLGSAKSKISERRTHYQKKIAESGITEKSARIDAILKLLS